MTHDLSPLLLLALAFLALFCSAELLYHKAGVRAEYTRKLVHAGTGFLTLLFPLVLAHFWQVALLCGSFFCLLLLSLKTGLLPSINAVERDTSGSLLYPVIVSLMFLFFQTAGHRFSKTAPLNAFYIPILTMAVCDPVAALVGQRIKAPSHTTGSKKTWQGSAAFFGSAFLLSAALQYRSYFSGAVAFSILLAFAVASVTTVAERLSGRGWDNFTIPATAAAVLWGFEQIPL